MPGLTVAGTLLRAAEEVCSKLIVDAPNESKTITSVNTLMKIHMYSKPMHKNTNPMQIFNGCKEWHRKLKGW